MWRNLDESNQNEGLNQIIKENVRTHAESLTANQDRSSFASDATSTRAKEFNHSSSLISTIKENLGPDLGLSSDITKSNDFQYQLNTKNEFPWDNEKFKHAYQVGSVGKALDKFGVLPQNAIRSLSTPSNDPPEENSKTSSILGTLKNFFI
ncbi:hypothetical protein MXB_506 [Myxobolus squamalis]|nr:hypothetical protein MXB_506 [Myxobolus squamalis]